LIVAHSIVPSPRLPITTTAAIVTTPLNSSPTIDRERMDKRYQSIRRTTSNKIGNSSIVDSSNVISSSPSSSDNNNNNNAN
ncbi:unnamed protein product, partial [Rotaria socialis]